MIRKQGNSQMMVDQHDTDKLKSFYYYSALIILGLKEYRKEETGKYITRNTYWCCWRNIESYTQFFDILFIHLLKKSQMNRISAIRSTVCLCWRHTTLFLNFTETTTVWEDVEKALPIHTALVLESLVKIKKVGAFSKLWTSSPRRLIHTILHLLFQGIWNPPKIIFGPRLRLSEV